MSAANSPTPSSRPVAGSKAREPERIIELIEEAADHIKSSRIMGIGEVVIEATLRHYFTDRLLDTIIAPVEIPPDLLERVERERMERRAFAKKHAALDALREARNGCGGWLTRRLQCGERAAGHVQLCRNCSTALDAAIATLLGGGDAITGLRNAVDHACAGCGDAEATRETDDGVELCDDCFVAVPVTQEGDDA